MELPTLIYSSKGTGRNSVWYSAALIQFGTQIDLSELEERKLTIINYLFAKTRFKNL